MPTSWLLAHQRHRWQIFILLASYVFYGNWDWRFVFLLGASTVGNHFFANLIHRSTSEKLRRTWLCAAVAANLGVLAWFKYYDFFVSSATNVLGPLGVNWQPPLRELILPVGISFITFQALSYIIDTYRRNVEPTSFMDFAVYLSFFPHLVAGPIVRASEFLPQLKVRRDPRQVDIGLAFGLVALGLFKKVVVSSYLSATIVDPVFAFPRNFGAFDTLLGIYGYAIQIYADFSGYTDMAIGLALLLGFTFPENFAKPYRSASLQEFWRRWHITLSRWLRDYLYIPLGGNRRSKVRGYVNLALTMILGGLWHGAAWTFVVWGTLHGVGLAIERWRADKRGAALAGVERTGWALWKGRLITFHVVCLGWVFFRAPTFSSAFDVLARLTHVGTFQAFNPVLVAVIAGALAAQVLPLEKLTSPYVWFSKQHWGVQSLVLSSWMVVCTVFGPIGVAPFIYFQF